MATEYTVVRNVSYISALVGESDSTAPEACNLTTDVDVDVVAEEDND